MYDVFFIIINVIFIIIIFFLIAAIQYRSPAKLRSREYFAVPKKKKKITLCFFRILRALIKITSMRVECSFFFFFFFHNRES